MANFENYCRSPSNALWTATSSLQQKNESRMVHGGFTVYRTPLNIFTFFFPPGRLEPCNSYLTWILCDNFNMPLHIPILVMLVLPCFAIGFSLSMKASRTGCHGGRSCCQVDVDHGLFEGARWHAGVLCVARREAVAPSSGKIMI